MSRSDRRSLTCFGPLGRHAAEPVSVGLQAQQPAGGHPQPDRDRPHSRHAAGSRPDRPFRCELPGHSRHRARCRASSPATTVMAGGRRRAARGRRRVLPVHPHWTVRLRINLRLLGRVPSHLSPFSRYIWDLGAAWSLPQCARTSRVGTRVCRSPGVWASRAAYPGDRRRATGLERPGSRLWTS